MRKFTLIFAVFAIVLCTLVSCGDNGDAVPDGLAVVKISEENGFKFYCPEGWTVINTKTDTDKEIWGAKMSSFTNISITLAKSEMPKALSIATDDATSLAAIKAYFKDSIDNEFAEKIKPTVITEPTLSNFGNAKEAYKAIYTFKYETYNFAVMQYYVKNNSDFYIFTYTSYGDVEDENSDYRVNLSKVETAIKSFEFTKKSSNGASEKPEYTKDEEGFNLVSKKELSGFELYLPDEMEVIVSDGYVTAKISDSASIYLGRITASGNVVSVGGYWDIRKSELERLIDKDTLDVIVENRINKADSTEKVILGNIAENQVAAYEFTYEIEGVKYHVYQLMGVTFFDGFVFTYTATEDEYSKHLDDIKKILSKVKF